MSAALPTAHPQQPRAPAPMPVFPGWSSPRRHLQQTLVDLTKNPNLRHLQQVHALIVRLDLHSLSPILSSAYSRAFVSLLRSRSLPPLSALARMHRLGLRSNNFTFPALLNSSPDLLHVKILHALALKSGSLSDIFVSNSLLDAYCRCGSAGLASARKVFDEMPERDVVSWNSMLAGFARCGKMGDARELFDGMPVTDVVSWNTVVDGYVKAGEVDEAFELFGRMPERNVVSWSTVMAGFCRKGDMEMARLLFDKMPVRNLVTWTIIVSEYAKKGLAKEADALFDSLVLRSGLRVDVATVVSILAACAESGLLGLGCKVHQWIREDGLKCSTQVYNALIDMYAKCGLVDEAWRVFDGMGLRNRVSWNSMIHCLAVHGHGERALSLFDTMIDEGIQPDGITFVGVLCACAHAGLIEEGRRYFAGMERDYGVSPKIAHFGCMVDLLGRGGLLNEAFELVSSMPIKPTAVIYGSLLSSSRTHKNVHLAEVAMKKFLELDDSDPGVYAIMSNIYANTKHWDDMAKMRLQMKSAGAQKPSGSSFIEVENMIHEFTAADKCHPQTTKILQMLGRLGDDLRQYGYVPEAPTMLSP